MIPVFRSDTVDLASDEDIKALSFEMEAFAAAFSAGFAAGMWQKVKDVYPGGKKAWDKDAHQLAREQQDNVKKRKATRLPFLFVGF